MSINPKYCLNPGCTLDNRYVIRHCISSGGFGITYEALDKRLNARVAIKELFSIRINDRANSNVIIGSANESQFNNLKKRFILEAQRLCSLSHPNIVRVTDVFEANNTAYMVMDYIEGTTLSNATLPLPETVVRKYLDQILNAIKYIHERNILHLDIKPANIMLDKNDNIILIDFGASRIINPINVNNDGSSNSISYTFHSPGYAPFEQVIPGNIELDTYTDIYALGATLFHLLNGKKPPMPNEIRDNGVPVISGVSNEMRNAITQALEPNASKRLFSINQFRRALNGEIINVMTEKQINEKERAEALQRRKEEDSLIQTRLIEQQKRRNEEARTDALKIWQDRQRIEEQKKHQEEILRKEHERRIAEDRKREMALRQEFAERQKRLQEKNQPKPTDTTPQRIEPNRIPLHQNSTPTPPPSKSSGTPISLQPKPIQSKPKKEYNAFIIAGTILAAIVVILAIMLFDNGDKNKNDNTDTAPQSKTVVDSTKHNTESTTEKAPIQSKSSNTKYDQSNQVAQPNYSTPNKNEVESYSTPQSTKNTPQTNKMGTAIYNTPTPQTKQVENTPKVEKQVAAPKKVATPEPEQKVNADPFKKEQRVNTDPFKKEQKVNADPFKKEQKVNADPFN